MFALPSPRDRLGGCVWLPRMLAKIRGLAQGTLPAEYAARFCDRDSVDEHFLQFFRIDREEMMEAASHLGTVDTISQWFFARPGVDEMRVAAWNEFAENLGRPGFPMAARLAEVLPKTYAHLDPAGVHSIFELLEADERATTAERSQP